MEHHFKLHIKTHFPLIYQQKIIVALSGGIDSMVLAHLLNKLKINIICCHCNFQLRDEESYQDALFVQNWAKQKGIPLEIKTFSTKQFSKENKMNTQLAARKLRYDWFENLRIQHQADAIATAHHADDNLETFLINLSRGTGLQGLSGIPEKTEHLIRPLLPFSRQKILQYAQNEKLQWREDSSNATDKYLRNKIRHHISNELKQLHPTFLSNFNKTINYIKQNQEFCNQQSEKLKNKYFKAYNDNQYTIDIEALKNEASVEFLLHQWFSPFGFKNIKDLKNLLSSESGKELLSPSHRLVKSRHLWVLSPIEALPSPKKIYFIDKQQNTIHQPLTISLKYVKKISNQSQNTVFVDADALKFPLKVRIYEKNDYFCPFGMVGRKKVYKFLKDEKRSVLDREKQWVLLSGNDIVWVMGLRADNRFKVKSTTKNILKISIIT